MKERNPQLPFSFTADVRVKGEVYLKGRDQRGSIESLFGTIEVVNSLFALEEHVSKRNWLDWRVFGTSLEAGRESEGWKARGGLALRLEVAGAGHNNASAYFNDFPIKLLCMELRYYKSTIHGFFKRKHPSSSQDPQETPNTSSIPVTENPCKKAQTKINDIDLSTLERDLGLRLQIYDYPNNQQDTVRRAYMNLGSLQPTLSAYPRFGPETHKRTFQAFWFRVIVNIGRSQPRSRQPPVLAGGDLPTVWWFSTPAMAGGGGVLFQPRWPRPLLPVVVASEGGGGGNTAATAVVLVVGDGGG
ncbi:hypothetical protein OSB04_013266 [Centaurea solstitialis]|uniref:Uncharacterized protein n=1 Tax=Centaurea solstitialis TaxID=347529 RepID=A0AA38WET9_9ASTR|nr:hypothetical protein OSB04_013266 [Centaurea solstitialis]